MKAYLLPSIFIFVCCICENTLVKIMPELKRTISNFGHVIYLKYDGMLAYSFDRFYAGMKFILPTMEDLKFSAIKFDSICNYLKC